MKLTETLRLEGYIPHISAPDPTTDHVVKEEIGPETVLPLR